MRTMWLTAILVLSGLVYSNSQESLSAERILARIDENYQAQTFFAQTEMTIHGRRGSRTIKAQSWSRGREKTFTEYLYPPRDKGTKMLKLKDELWMYSPQTDRIIKIAGHMLKQSVMGSDLSYEDFMESDRLNEDYRAELIGGEPIDGRACYILQLTAKRDDVSYASRKIWVDKQRFLALKEERFAKSGKLLKVTEIKEVMRIDDRWYPKKILFKDALKTGKGTAFVIDTIEFNIDVPDYKFTKAALR